MKYEKDAWINFSDLNGKSLGGFTKIEDNENDALIFCDDTGQMYMMTHTQDCCENVWLDDVCGSWDDIEWEPLVEALETVETMENASESGTWSFYTFKTFKGSLTLRWCGESNGYYSETVDLYKIKF